MYISRNLGQVSVSEERRSRAPGLFGPETITQGYAARPLLTPDEVRMLGRDEVIILSRDALPIRGKRLGFPDLKVLRERAKLRPTRLHKREEPTPPERPASDNEGQASAKESHTPSKRREVAQPGVDKQRTDHGRNNRNKSKPRPTKRYIDPEEA